MQPTIDPSRFNNNLTFPLIMPPSHFMNEMVACVFFCAYDKMLLESQRYTSHAQCGPVVNFGA